LADHMQIRRLCVPERRDDDHHRGMSVRPAHCMPADRPRDAVGVFARSRSAHRLTFRGALPVVAWTAAIMSSWDEFVCDCENLGHYQRVGNVQDYSALSVQARLAAGLLTVEAWLRRYRIEDEGTTTVLEHMWQFMTVTAETFQAWYDFKPEALLAAESEEPVPAPAAAACRQYGAAAQDLATMLGAVVNIVYESLFGALDLNLSMARLREIATVATRSGIGIPAASRFGHMSVHEFHGWGNPVSAAQVVALRSHTDLHH
jgi:hypothetical protein